MFDKIPCWCFQDSIKAFSSLYWWPAAYRGTSKIFRYTGKILPVASLLQSAFSVSISGQHLLLHQADIKEDHTIARPVCLLKRARVGALSEGNMVEATSTSDEKSSAFQS